MIEGEKLHRLMDELKDFSIIELSTVLYHLINEHVENELVAAEKEHEPQISERNENKVKCSDCKKTCTVPFKPNLDRPVYCRECYDRRN